MSAIILNEEHTKRYDAWLAARNKRIKIQNELLLAKNEEKETRNTFASCILPDNMRHNEQLSLLIDSNWLLFKKETEENYEITFRA